MVAPSCNCCKAGKAALAAHAAGRVPEEGVSCRNSNVRKGNAAGLPHSEGSEPAGSLPTVSDAALLQFSLAHLQIKLLLTATMPSKLTPAMTCSLMQTYNCHAIHTKVYIWLIHCQSLIKQVSHLHVGTMCT